MHVHSQSNTKSEMDSHMLKVVRFQPSIYWDMTFPLAVKRMKNDTHRYRFKMSAQINPISGSYFSGISTLSMDLQTVIKSMFLFYDFCKISERMTLFSNSEQYPIVLKAIYHHRCWPVECPFLHYFTIAHHSSTPLLSQYKCQ